ncbi:MAG: STAS domain-containing protein [Venatoribacter sp.]
MATTQPQGFVLEGEFTIYRAQELKEQLVQWILASPKSQLNLELNGITEVDTAGLQLLLLAKRESYC